MTVARRRNKRHKTRQWQARRVAGIRTSVVCHVNSVQWRWQDARISLKRFIIMWSQKWLFSCFRRSNLVDSIRKVSKNWEKTTSTRAEMEGDWAKRGPVMPDFFRFEINDIERFSNWNNLQVIHSRWYANDGIIIHDDFVLVFHSNYTVSQKNKTP